MNESSFWLCTSLVGLALIASSCTARKLEMIDVGDHKLAMVRDGYGGPTVVFESGGGGDGLKAWRVIQPRVGKFAATISYARAGRYPSDAANGPRTLTVVVQELHTMLQRAGAPPPYVLVGVSLGGLYVRAFAALYPQEVAGLVLVESTHERQWLDADKIQGLKPGMTLAGKIKDERAKKQELTAQELEGLADVWASGRLGFAGRVPDVPTAVLTGAKRPAEVLKIWQRLQDELLTGTTHGQHIISPKSGHDLADQEPDLVVDATRWVVDAGRAHRRDKN